MALWFGWAGSQLGVALWPVTWPLALQVVLGILIADGLEYARHRAEHRYGWLWRVHALHHSVDRMHVLKSGRGHFLDMVLRHLTVFLPLAAIGTPPTILLAYVAAVAVLGTIGHSNVDMRLPGFLQLLATTRHVHRIHHACDGDLALANYANVFPVWTRCSGRSAYPPACGPPASGSSTTRCRRRSGASSRRRSRGRAASRRTADMEHAVPAAILLATAVSVARTAWVVVGFLRTLTRPSASVDIKWGWAVFFVAPEVGTAAGAALWLLADRTGTHSPAPRLA